MYKQVIKQSINKQWYYHQNKNKTNNCLQQQFFKLLTNYQNLRLEQIIIICMKTKKQWKDIYLMKLYIFDIYIEKHFQFYKTFSFLKFSIHVLKKCSFKYNSSKKSQMLIYHKQHSKYPSPYLITFNFETNGE